MRIKILNNAGKCIPLDKRYLFEVDETSYEATRIGKEYDVYGIMLIRDRIDVLISPEGAAPFWVPKQTYNVTDEEMANSWFANIISDNSPYTNLNKNFCIKMLMGYRRLVCDYQHYVGLLEGVNEELQYFYREIRNH